MRNDRQRDHDGMPVVAALTPPPRPDWVAPWSDGVLIGCFVLFLAIPFLGFVYGQIRGGEIRLEENRKPAPAPRFGKTPVAQLPEEVEAYFKDRFGLRTELVHAYNILLRKWLRVSGLDAVIGREDWLFYAREGVFDDFFGRSQLTRSQLRAWKLYLEERKALMEARGGHYLFVVAPNKNSIYPEMLPEGFAAHRGRSRLQQLRDYLRETGASVDFLDLTDSIVAAKSEGLVYFPQDTHWNGRGHLAAYQAICRYLARWRPGLAAQTLGKDYAIRRMSADVGDWGLYGMADENYRFPSDFLAPLGTQRARRVDFQIPAGAAPVPQHWLTPLLWAGPGDGSLLVLHDSFMRAGTLDRTHAPLAEHFSRTLLVGSRDTHAETQLYLDAFRPDVVIEERVERTLGAVPLPPRGVDAPATCAVSEDALASADGFRVLNATATRQGDALEIQPVTIDPMVLFRPPARRVEYVYAEVEASEYTTLELFGVGSASDPTWTQRPSRAGVAPGRNTVLLAMPAGQVQEIRLDPVDRKIPFTLRKVLFQSGCQDPQ